MKKKNAIERVINTRDIYDKVKEECGQSSDKGLLLQEGIAHLKEEYKKHFNYYWRKERAKKKSKK